MDVVFSKKTILKNRIVEGTIKGFRESHLAWLDLANKGGHLDKPLELEPILESDVVVVDQEEFENVEDLEDVSLT
jgi:hypothetical protein